LKTDFRLSKNFLKGVIGDEINLLMAANSVGSKEMVSRHFLVPIFKKAKLKLRQIDPRNKSYYPP